jgi:hypothetical protein
MPFYSAFSILNMKYGFLIFIVVPCILKSKASHLPTDALFITLGN